nr:MAG: polyprotein [Marnaviridae sp.]
MDKKVSKTFKKNKKFSSEPKKSDLFDLFADLSISEEIPQAQEPSFFPDGEMVDRPSQVAPDFSKSFRKADARNSCVSVEQPNCGAGGARDAFTVTSLSSARDKARLKRGKMPLDKEEKQSSSFSTSMNKPIRANDSDMTRKGYLHTDSEKAGIEKKKKEVKKERKRAQFASFREASKARTIERSQGRVFTDTSVEVKEKPPSLKYQQHLARRARQIEKERNEAYREVKKEARMVAKSMQKARRKERRMQTESDEKVNRDLTQMDRDWLVSYIGGIPDNATEDWYAENYDPVCRILQELASGVIDQEVYNDTASIIDPFNFDASQGISVELYAHYWYYCFLPHYVHRYRNGPRRSSLKRMRTESATISEALSHLGPKGLDALFTKMLGKEAMDEISEGLEQGYRDTEWIVDLMILLHGVLWSRNASNTFFFVWWYMNKVECSGLTRVAVTGIATFFSTKLSLVEIGEKKESVQTESLSDFFESAASLTTVVVQSPAYTALRDLALSLMSLRLFSADHTFLLKKYLGKPKACSVLETIQDVFKSMSRLVRIGELLNKGVAIHDALLADDPYSEFLKRSKGVLACKEFLYVGLPKEGYVDATEWLRECKDLVRVGKLLQTKLNSRTCAHSTISAKLVELERATEDAHRFLMRKPRLTPVGVIIEGDPGIGKSGLINYVATVHSQVKGRTFDPTHVYHRVRATDYWDGYDPACTPYVHYSEVGADYASRVERMGDPIVQELTSILDSQPMALNMAAVEDKGKVFCNMEMVIIDTNCPDMNLAKLVNNPAATRRRFLYILPKVKAEFQNANGGLDASKHIEGVAYFDKWEFTVYTQEPRGISKSVKVDLLTRASIYELTTFLMEYFRNHIESQERHAANIGSIDLDEYLPGEEEKKDVQAEVLSLPVPKMMTFQELSFTIGGYLEMITHSYDYLQNIVIMCTLSLMWKMISISVWPKFIDFLWLMFRIFCTVLCMISCVFVNPLIAGVAWYAFYRTCTIGFRDAGSGPLYGYARRQSKRYYAKAQQSRVQWMIYLGLDSMCNAFASTEYYTWLIYGLFGAGAFYLLRKVWDTVLSSSQFKAEVSAFPTTDHSELLRQMEEKLGCGKSYPRVQVKGANVWNVQEVVPSIHVSDVESLYAKVSRNCRHAIISDGMTTQRTYLLGVKQNYAILNKHCFLNLGDRVSIDVCRSTDTESGYFRTELYTRDLVDISEDTVMVVLSGVMFTDIVAHFPADDINFSFARGYIRGHAIQASRHKDVPRTIYHKDKPIRLFGPVSYNWDNHDPGTCGSPVVAQRDSGACIVGIHAAGDTQSPSCFAEYLVRSKIEHGVRVASGIHPRAEVLSDSPFPYEVHEPTKKSVFRYEHLPHVDYFGHDGHAVNINQTSKLQKTKLAPSLPEAFLDILELPVSKRYVKPLMKPISHPEYTSPYNVGIKKINALKKGLDPYVLDRVIARLCKRIDERFTQCDLRLSPLDFETAVNGIGYDPYIRRMSMNKAAGFGTPGKKSKYFIRYGEGPDIVDVPIDDLQRQVVEAAEQLSKGLTMHCVYKAQLKDEPRSMEKRAKGATRVFFTSPLVALILQRMFLNPFYSLLVQHGGVFNTAIGVDMHREAGLIRDRVLHRFNNVIEGDFGGYDTSMPFDIGLAVNTIVVHVLEKYGYGVEALAISTGLLSDNMFPVVNMLGDFFRVPGLQPSGKAYTAEDNSLRNLVVQLYCWEMADTGGEDFFDHVDSLTYGDDLLGSVSDAMKDKFNNLVIAEMCETYLGMTYTSSDKTATLTPFVSEEKMSFLKRNFRYHDVLERWVAPLEVDSLFKMLEWTLPSGSVNKETQLVQSCSSCLRELVFHVDEGRHDRFRKYLITTIVDNYGLQKESVEDALPTYYALIASLRDDQCDAVEEGRRLGVDNVTGANVHTPSGELLIAESCTISAGRFSSPSLGWLGDLLSRPAAESNIRVMINSLVIEQKSLEEELASLPCPCPGISYKAVKKLHLYNTDMAFKEQCDRYFRVKATLESNIQTAERLRRWVSAQHTLAHFRTESDETSTMKSGSVPSDVVTSHENLVDVSGESPEQTIAGASTSLQTGQKNKLSVDEFLARPITVGAVTIPVGNDLNYRISIWDAFLSHPSIRAKVRNYAYLRGTLNVRIAVSGSPFHYGKLMVSYQPLAGLNATLAEASSLLTSTYRKGGLTYLSQAPGMALVDVKDNKPLDIVCPFISPQPMIRLFNKSPLIIAEATPFQDALNMGDLFITSVNPVRCASATPSSVSMFIYAWMTDVELGCPTGTVLTVGTESDERKVGPVEKFATRASEIAYALTSVPVIQPFAHASGMALEGIGALAALFGFSYPTMINEPMRTKNEPYRNGAQTIGYDLGQRITLDPKQEVSVDPRVLGTSDDDMAISAITSRMSYLDSVEWEPEVIPLSSSIWSCPVTPTVGTRSTSIVAGKTLVQPTALCFAALPFSYWRGDMWFRIQIAASSQHRGKFAVYYEPNVAQNVVIDTELDMNKQFLCVVDIQETQCVDFCIEWAHAKPWARVVRPTGLPLLGTLGEVTNQVVDGSNGYIAIVPFTALQSPDNSSVSINIYVAGEDMCFNQLVDSNVSDASRYVTESADVSGGPDVKILNPSTATTAHISEEYFGEVPVSFRALLKRFTTTADIVCAGSPNALTVLTAPIFPSDSADFTSGGALTPNLFAYLRYAYLGWKGGLRKRLFYYTVVEPGRLAALKVSLAAPGGSDATSFVFSAARENYYSKMLGTVSFVPHTNGGFEFELPFYTNNSFAISCNPDCYPDFDTLFDSNVSRRYIASLLCAYTGGVSIMEETASGEDFSFMRFQGAPGILYQGS